MGKKFVLQSKYFPRRHTQKDIEGKDKKQEKNHYMPLHIEKFDIII